MPVLTETMQVTGIRCERCVGRLASTLRNEPGLEQANANLMGQVTLAWDDEQTSREPLLAAMARGGFRPVETKAALRRRVEAMRAWLAWPSSRAVPSVKAAPTEDRPGSADVCGC